MAEQQQIPNNVKEIAELARRAELPAVLEITEKSIREEPIPVVGRWSGGQLHLESLKNLLADWRDAPERIEGRAKADTLGSFVDLVNRHKNDDSAVFGNLGTRPAFTAVIDYHTVDHSPKFGRHRIVYEFPLSPEWIAWQVMNGKPMSQSDWAAFIEEHIADLSSPYDAEKSQYEPLFQTTIASPSDLITMSRGMQIAVDARVKEVRNLQSGEAEIVYEEVHKDGSGQKLVVPGLFVLNLPLFVGSQPTRLVARLRYRRQDSKITWFYQLYRADLVLRAELQNAFDQVGTETGLPTFEAAPEA
jgi:uncharacterized protein YfdQ (DUF2303 family)